MTTAVQLKTVVQFLNFDCLIIADRYQNGQLALELVGADTANNRARDLALGEPVTRATVCLVSEQFGDRETALKNHDENAGVLDVLVSAGVLAGTGREVENGWTRYPVVRLLIPTDRSD